MGAEKNFREECDQTKESRLRKAAGLNAEKRVATDEAQRLVDSTNIQRSSWNSPGGPILSR